MRLLLVLVLVHGLAPGIAELAEAAVHFARTGHVAHSAEDRGDLGEQGPEHGCGATRHQCTCCSPQVVTAASDGATVTLAGASSSPREAAVRRPASRELQRPFRPPIS